MNTRKSRGVIEIEIEIETGIEKIRNIDMAVEVGKRGKRIRNMIVTTTITLIAKNIHVSRSIEISLLNIFICIYILIKPII